MDIIFGREENKSQNIFIEDNSIYSNDIYKTDNLKSSVKISDAGGTNDSLTISGLSKKGDKTYV